MTDVASVPLPALLLSIAAFALDPVTNGFSRRLECQADLFGRAWPHIPKRRFPPLRSSKRSIYRRKTHHRLNGTHCDPLCFAHLVNPLLYGKL
jgi:hypothetical protein